MSQHEHELPPALAERRAELQRRMLEDEAELRGIDAAANILMPLIEEGVPPDFQPGNGVERRPRRDIRAMVKDRVDSLARAGMQETPALMAEALGCRVSQVEAALRLIPASAAQRQAALHGGEE